MAHGLRDDPTLAQKLQQCQRRLLTESALGRAFTRDPL
jgi:hypothetical protein